MKKKAGQWVLSVDNAPEPAACQWFRSGIHVHWLRSLVLGLAKGCTDCRAQVTFAPPRRRRVASQHGIFPRFIPCHSVQISEAPCIQVYRRKHVGASSPVGTGDAQPQHPSGMHRQDPAPLSQGLSSFKCNPSTLHPL